MGQHAIAPDPYHNRCCSDGDCLGIDLLKDKESLIVGVGYKQKLFFLMNFLNAGIQVFIRCLNPGLLTNVIIPDILTY